MPPAPANQPYLGKRPTYRRQGGGQEARALKMTISDDGSLGSFGTEGSRGTVGSLIALGSTGV